MYKKFLAAHVKSCCRRKRVLFILSKKRMEYNSTKAEKRKVNKKIKIKIRINRFYVTIKLRHNMVIFQQQIIWEERGTSGYPKFYKIVSDPVA